MTALAAVLRRVRTAVPVAVLSLVCCASAVAAAGASVPLDAASPWPEMRHDSRNTRLSPIVARYHGDRPWVFQPWVFQTGRGIFSTPVIGADGTIYVGSADSYFYAIAPDGRLRWRLKTGGLIDAAGALAAEDRWPDRRCRSAVRLRRRARPRASDLEHAVNTDACKPKAAVLARV